MLKLVKNYLNNFVLRLVFLLVVLLVVLGVSARPFIFVKAFNSRINVVPENFALEQEDGDFIWGNVSKSFYQDLSNEAQFADFNQDNSAYILSDSVALPAPQNDSQSEPVKNDNEGKDDSVNNSSGQIAPEKDENKPVVPDVIDAPSENSSSGETAPEAGTPIENPTPESAPREAPAIDAEAPASQESSFIDNLRMGKDYSLLSFRSGAEKSLNCEYGTDKGFLHSLRSLRNDKKEFFSGLNFGNKGFINSIKDIFASKPVLATGNVLEQKIIYSNFSVPKGYEADSIGKVNLRMSLAAESAYTKDSLSVQYKIDDDWQNLGEIKLDKKFVNAPGGDFFRFDLSNIKAWDEFDRLKIRVSYNNEELFDGQAKKDVHVYLDALWLEIDYNDEQEQIRTEESETDVLSTEEEAMNEAEALQNAEIKRIKDNFELLQETEQKHFKSNERPNFRFKFREKRNIVGRVAENIGGLFYDKYKDVEITPRILDAKGSVSETDFSVKYVKNGEIAVDLASIPRQFHPGKYSIEFTFKDADLTEGKEIVMSQEFVWGVLAINANKSVYLQGEKAYLQMAVLDDFGDTICDADLTLEITAPDGGMATLSTINSLVFYNEACGKNNVIDTPDYYAFYSVGRPGTYQMKLRASTRNGVKEITDAFEVREILPFEVERIGPTRIYPKADYEMRFNIVANADFKGEFKDFMPISFGVTEQKQYGAILESIAVNENGPEKEIAWQVDWQAGKEYSLSYRFDAPNISPEFYVLGPADLNGQIGFLNGSDLFWENYEFKEIRQWQLASDALSVVFNKNTANVVVNGTDYDDLTTLTGFTNGAYILFGGVGSVATDDDTSRITTSLGLNSAGTAIFEASREVQEGPSIVGTLGGWGYFSMMTRTMSSAETIYLTGYDNSGLGTADESFIMGIATSSLGVHGLDYFWAVNNTLDTSIGTTLAAENDRASVTFTPDGTSQYLILATAKVDTQVAPSGAGDEIQEMAIWNGSTSLPMVNHIRNSEDTADYSMLFAATTTIPAATMVTYSVRVRGESVNTIDHASSSILIIRLNYYENFNCNATTTLGLIGTTAAVTATTTLRLDNTGDVVALYFGGFSSSAVANRVAFRARQDSTTRYQITEANKTGGNPGRNMVWETTDVSNVMWLDNITAVDTNSHVYDLAMQTNTSGPVAVSSLVCVWSEAERPSAIVSATGTQVTSLDYNSQNNYVGGAFAIRENIASSSVTSIMITENGTVNAATNLADIRLRYEMDTTAPYDCASESFGGTELQFGATSSAFSSANGTSTFSGAVTISTSSTMCVYTILNVGSGAGHNETIEIYIANPSTDVVLAYGTVRPATSIALAGTTNIILPQVSASANAQRKSDNFTDIANQGWTNENQINLSSLAGNMAAASTSRFSYYFQTLDEVGTFATTTGVPSSSCSSGTAYGSCSPKIWTINASTTPWYNTNWAYRKKITINASQVATTTSGFVILATTTDSALAYTGSGGHVASSTGGDIIVIDSDGATKLDYQREYYNSATGQLVIWVETDVSSTTNKVIYLYYGNPANMADQQNQTGTWASQFVYVNHMNNDPGPGTTGDMKDSTANANNGTATADMTSADLIAGYIGYSIDFDGVNDNLSVPDSASFDSSTGAGQARTWSYWLNFTAVTENTLITDKSNFSGTELWSEAHASPNKIRGGTGGGNQLNSGTTFATGQWYYLVFEHNGTADRLYVNGVLDAGPNAQTAPADNNQAWQIMGSGGNYEVNGMMDELRVTNVSHTAGWVQTEYNNQKDVAKFLSIASEESFSSATYEGVVNIVTLPERGSSTDSTLGYKWQVIVCNFENQCSAWDDFSSSTPNFKVDTSAPSAPGNLSLSTTTATTIKLNLGSQTNEANFAYYRIFYKTGLSGVDTDDTQHSDANLNYQNYNNAASTTITNLESDTQYVINIWAYDLAGNKTAASEIVVTTQAAPHARARSVQFYAGDYSSTNGLSGQLTNTNQTYSTFNFNLAETGVTIRSAYVLFESQFEAYHTNSTDYTGYQMSFDACAEPCTANATTGTGRAFIDSNSVLAYNEADGNQVRILFDVTEEAQLLAYSGDSANMQAQFGYQIKTNTATSSIASTRAILVVTYAFNEDASTNYTNTVVYPLESAASGDSGSKRASTTDDCTKNSNCPTFSYNAAIPEVGAKVSQWFIMNGTNDGHGTNDVLMNVNLQGYDVDSDNFYHESANGGEQGHFPAITFDGVYGYAENSSQVLEYYLTSPGVGVYYLLGGETVETYTAAKSAGTKTRTASFPIGVITTGQTTSLASSSAFVYFPENGTGNGVVDIKKAWFRIISNDYNSGLYTVTVSSKTGSNSTSANYVYNIDAGTRTIKPSFKIIHVIPSADYSELELANASTPKEVVINTTNSSVNIGGVSAELMITYSYTDESTGYLSSLNLFGGQSGDDANSQNDTESTAAVVFPEMRGTKIVRTAGLLGGFLFADSDGSMPAAWFNVDINIATSSPSCNPTSNYSVYANSVNSFAEYFKSVTPALTAIDEQGYSACYANTNALAPTAGAKMNSILFYTYQWNAPLPELIQSNWRWYDNVDDITPSTAKAAEKASISGVNLGDILRVRMNIAVTKTTLATSTQAYSLQYAEGSVCSDIASTSWTNVGGVAAATPWRGYNNPNPADGASLVSTKLSSSTVAQSYEEANNSVSNPKSVPANGYAEWDWVLYDYAATSSSDYCFRMVQSDGTALDDYVASGYPQLTTAPENTRPNLPAQPDQFRSNGTTTIANGAWINANTVVLSATATDPNMSEQLTLYFEVASSTASFTTATNTPSSSCVSGTAYNSCTSKIWRASSTIGDYRTAGFIGTTSVSGLPDYDGYKWQVLACDDSGECSSWSLYDVTVPNFKTDNTAPSAPGNLLTYSVSPTSVTLTLGATTSETNFLYYKIYYKVGTTSVTEADVMQVDDNLDNILYNGATSTIVSNLSSGIGYVFNIWAYDQAGNKAKAAIDAKATTTVTLTPPTGFIMGSSRQRTDGSGIVDITILVDDADNNDTLRAKIMFNTACNFSGTSSDPTLDTADTNTFATYGDPDVDNSSPYQVGTTTGWIMTSPGQNYVFFDWFAGVDLAGISGDFCLGLVVNDGTFNQVATHTRAITLDNLNPTAPGPLTLVSKNTSSVTLRFGTSSMDANFSEYKIFYKEGTAGVSESDAAWTKANDINLDDADYKLATTTTITGLSQKVDYVFNIWAYDTYGNKASATTELLVKTNAAPTNIAATNQYLGDGITAIANASWISSSSVVLKASAHDQDSLDLVTFYYELIAATGTYSAYSSIPTNTCAYGTSYNSCSSHIWAVSTTTSSLPTSWYDGGWLYRKQITINSAYVSTTTSNFPVMIDSTDSDLADEARPDGYDILITDSTGTTTLNYEREFFNPTTGQFVAWVKTDVSSTTNTILYMYYGNPEINTDPSTTTGAWDNNFRGVWHLEENVVDESTSLAVHRDSSFYANHGDQYGNNEILAKIYQGQDFDGINDYLNIADNNSLDLTNAMTMSFWMNGEIGTMPSASSTVYSTAGSQNFTVPAGVTKITVKVWGGGGGGGGGANGGSETNRNSGGNGGGGGFVLSTINVVPGETLSIIVGGGGGGGGYLADASSGGGGGGRSQVARSTSVLASAGGGAGGGGGSSVGYTPGADGGPGGGSSGVAGSNTGVAVGGGGGTQSAGGTAGTGANNGSAGSLASGGAGADGRNGQLADGGGGTGGSGGGAAGGLGDVSNRYAGAGGGGGGYYGGGGGGAGNGGGAGGGGGSSYATSTATATSTSAGSNRNAGNNTDEDYSGNAGLAGLGGDYLSAGSAGNPGLVVIEFTPSITLIGKGSNAFQINLNNDNYISAQINSQGISTPITSGWHHVALTYNQSAGGTTEMKFFLDGIVKGTADYSTAINTNASPIIIGSAFNGIIDELRISTSSRSEGWIRTAYNNQNSPGTFLTIGSESTVTSYFQTALVVSIPDNPDYSTGFKWQVKACDDDMDCTNWQQFNATTPNFKIDTTDPSAPGQLSLNSKTSNTITLNFGTSTDEDNFTEYRIYYTTNATVTESDTLYGSTTDANLLSKSYNGASGFTISNLNPSTTYRFNIWAYDVVGHKASSTITTITTNAAIATPGAMFYTKNNRAVYYRVWSGTAWGAEQTSGNITGVGENIRHIRSVRSDNGAKTGLLLKTWDGTNQKWFGVVYRFAANDFVSTSSLGTTWASATNNDLMTACIAPLSGGEFVIIRNNNAGNGAVAFSWDALGGWTSEGVVPGTDTTGKFGVMNGCNLVRRPATDNYLLMTFDDSQYVGSMYYYGGATFSNAAGAWTAWTDHSSAEKDINNFVGDAYFDPSNNGRGALYYSNSLTNNYAYAKYFTCTANSINYGGSQPSPAVAPNDWGGDFVHGEFASDPGGTGIAYFVGRDLSGQLNAYQVNASNPTISWSTVTNGDNISSGNLYSQANNAQKPFTARFYKSGKGVVLGDYSVNAAPFYSIITTSGNTLSATTSVEGAGANIYPRVMLYDDPNEDEMIAVFQNDDIDYSAVFWDPGNSRFYNSGNQAWNELVTVSGAADADFECTSYSYAKFNSAPSSPTNLGQYKSTGTTTIANLGWTDESTVRLNASVIDIDTREAVRVYLQLITNNDTFATTSDYTTFNACASTTTWTACNSKIWLVASSTSGDYSVAPYTATATITSIASSTIGYKWQMLSCDDENLCSTWQIYNAVTPNFYVDTQAPSAPGNLSINTKTSQSITLNYGAATDEPAVSFREYKIFYKIGSSGVTEADTPWTQVNDANLSNRTYNGVAFTVITGLSSSTQYVFNIWAYDKAGNKATATTEISTTTSALPAVRQSSFIWENDNGSTVNLNSSAATASTSLTNVKIGTRLAARIQIENVGGDTKTNNVYKLQYENLTDTPGTWLDVTSTTSISYSLGLSGANNDPITSYKAEANAKTWHNGAWQEYTNITGNITLAYNEYTELAFMINTANATTSKTYRLRLYDVTESKVFSSYAKYPTLSTASTDTTRYSKGLITPLPTVKNDLDYYFDPLGYTDVLSDNSVYDVATSSANNPVFLFATKHTNNTDAASSTWNGQSSVSTITNNAVLQIFRFGSTNAWVTVDTESGTGANTDFTLTGGVNSLLSEYYGPNNWIYWRVYQVSGTMALRTDLYSANFAPAVPSVSQIHYRWRADNGTETSATWLENEDIASPVTGSQIGKGSTTRLRFEVANTGGGSATNYSYRLEYAVSAVGCASDPGGWIAVPTAFTTEHFDMVNSTYFGDASSTTAQLANSEAYTFVAGDMIEDPTNASANLTLSERRYTEIEYAFQVTTNAVDAQTYCFRVTRGGTALDGYGVYAQVTLSGNTNNAPVFTVQPTDNDASGPSASTSPTDEGTNITFNATAGDADGNQYYLAICKSAGVSAGNDAAPTCTGGSWCVSTATASGTAASCIYTAATTTEVNAWYAYACDKVSGFGLAKCSVLSQGTGTNGYASPFVINHAPVYASVATVVNNLNPGQYYRITASVTDNDVDGGADTMNFYVCGSNSATVAGCNGQTLCSEIATTSPDASCTFATTTPALAGTYSYYTFIFDSHNLAATPASRNGTYTVNNASPVLGTLVLNGGSTIILNINGAGDTAISTVNASVEDLNGCQDLESAVGTIYMSNASSGYNCTADDNQCYQIIPAGCVVSNCASSSDMIATYTCTANMKYFAVPTDSFSANNPWKNYTWLSYMNIYDGVNYVVATSAPVELQTNLAIEIPQQWIDFGSGLYAGDNTGTRNSTTTIENSGNSPLDANIQGTQLDGVSYAGNISVDWIKYDLNSFNYELGTNILQTYNQLVDVIAPRSTSAATTSADIMYWGIGIPFVAYPDIYRGRNTFFAVLDDDNW